MVSAITSAIVAPAGLADTSLARAAAYGIIYRATAPNGKCYIGQTTQPLKYRKRQDGAGYKNCRAFARAIAKYGADNIHWRVIGLAVNQSALDEAEQFAIAHHNTLAPNGYNLTSGGGNGKPSAQTRERMSLAHKNAPPPSITTREKISLAGIGRKHSEAAKDKMRKPKSQQARMNMSAAAKGRVITLAQRQKISATLTGRKQPPRSAAYCANISAAQKKRWAVING